VVAGAIEADQNAKARAYYGPPPPGSNLVYDTQSALLRLGYNPGPPDGVYGQRTAEAIQPISIHLSPAGERAGIAAIA